MALPYSLSTFMKFLYLFLVGAVVATARDNNSNNEAEVTVFESPRPTAQINDVGLQQARRPPKSLVSAGARQQQVSDSLPRNNKVFTMVKPTANSARPTAPPIAPSSNNSKHSQRTRTLFTFSVDNEDIADDDNDELHNSGKKKAKGGNNRKSDDISNHVKQNRDESAAISIAHLNYKAMVVTVSTAMAIFGMGSYF